MTDAQQREAARQFFYKWNGKGKEDEDARSYWIDLLSHIFGMENATDRVQFEKKVAGDKSKKRIDAYIPETHVLIEQKSLGIPLDKPQPSHHNKTPYEQAKEYDNLLPFGEKSRWIILSNFAEIWIYDMAVMKPEPVKLLLADLPVKYHLLDFLIRKEVKKVTDEMKVSLQAGELVGKLYDAFLKQYKDPEDTESLKSLNKLCVRIVFCLYAEDADIFGKKNMFHNYMAQFDAVHARNGLRNLFRVLNQKPEERDQYLADDDPKLAAFPYVNGGLFEDDNIEIPPFTDEIMALLLQNASEDFNWSEISPTIFGAVFESTLNPVMRRVEAVREYRLRSPSAGTRKIADTPTRFHVTNMPKGDYIVIPEVSSERRRYVPIGYMTPDIMCSNLVKILPDASLYHFGILTLNVHMAWVRTVCGRLKSDYRYSKDIVYNNFPWPSPTDEQKQKIEQTAQGILDARALYPDASLADIYDPLTMPPELQKAHSRNDVAVMKAYGMPIKETDEASCVAWLMKMYQEMIKRRNGAGS